MADNVALLQHQLNRFGVVTVMDAMFYEVGSPKPLLKLDTLKVSSISMDGSTKEIRGGMAADLLLAYNHSRTINLEMTDALLSMYSLKQVWGSTIEDVVAVRSQETAEVTTAGTAPSYTKTFIKKDGTAGDPAIGTDYVLFNETQGIYIEKQEDITSTNLAVDDVVTKYGFVQPAAADNPIQTILKSTTFPSAVTIIGRTVFLDENTGKEILAEIEIPRFQMGNTFDFSMDAEGEAATFNFSGVALASGSDKELIKIKQLKKGTNLMDEPWEI